MVKALLRKARADEADATIAQVTMTERRSYGRPTPGIRADQGDPMERRGPGKLVGERHP